MHDTKEPQQTHLPPIYWRIQQDQLPKHCIAGGPALGFTWHRGDEQRGHNISPKLTPKCVTKAADELNPLRLNEMSSRVKAATLRLLVSSTYTQGR